MSVPYKLIEETENFKIYEATFENQKQLFRIGNNGVSEIKFTNEYARANGYENIQDLFNKIPGFKEHLIQTCGSIPKWIRIEDGSKFILRYTQTNASMN